MKANIEQFSAPLLNDNIIQRIKLVMEIDRLSERGILFIHSPAGYGKTTAVALWARKKNTAWFSLDEYSCDAAIIYKRLLLALSCEISAGYDDAPLEYTLKALEKHAGSFPEAIVIDDFHLCNDLSVARSLPMIRSRLPQGTAFIIISRNPPPEILIDQILKGIVREINALQFTVNEIIALFNKNRIQISEYEAQIIQKKTQGWAVALSAILLSEKKFSSNLLDSQTLNDYFRTYVFDYRKDYHILKKCAVCDILYPSLCNEVTGQNNAWEIISDFAAQTGLLTRTGKDTYRFHALLKEFLESELVKDKTIDELSLYKAAARQFKKDGDILRAIHIAAKSRDIAMVEEYMSVRDDEYGKFDAGVEENTLAIINYIYSEIPASAIKQSTRLSFSCINALFQMGRLEEGYEFIDAVKTLMQSGKGTQMDIISMAFWQCVDPRGKIRDIPEVFGHAKPFLEEAKAGKISSYTITFNYPFFHRTEIDLTDASPCIDEFIGKLKKYMGNIPVIIPFIQLTEAGLRYERGEIDKAERLAFDGISIAHLCPPELHFSALCLYAEIMRVQGKTYKLDAIRTMIAKRNAHYLSANFNAFTANIQLYNGDEDTANRWLSQCETEETLRVYKMYQYFTTARSLMVAGKLSEAEKLLQRIIDVSLRYRRPADFIEAQVLRSICFWNMKRQTDAIQAMTDAICKAYELELVMPIIKEGGDILSILKNILHRLKYGYGTDQLDKSFVSKLYHTAEDAARFRGMMVRRNKNKPIKLSPRQLEMLALLERNFSYKEIAEKLGIKVTTVVDHIVKLYEKLGASNSLEAVTKARELGIRANLLVNAM
jgi:LuxR family maltose regulon positive regulatory protein